MKYSPIPQKLFKKNREKLFAGMHSESIAILNAADEMPRNGDTTFAYRQNSNFFYLSGIEQEKSILLLCSKNNRSILFLQETNELLETWVGRKLSKQEVTNISGIEEIYWLTDFEEVLKRELSSVENIYINDNEHPKVVSDIPSRETRFLDFLKKEYPSFEYKLLSSLIIPLRLVKEPEEIALINKACEITEETFLQTLKTIKPHKKEYEIEAQLAYGFLSQGASAYSFAPIVASGEKALSLHYIDNSKTMNDNELVLLDFGCEYANYASDCSCTVPVNGKFSQRQKECYQAVLRAFNYAKPLFVVGNCIENINKKVSQFLEKEMIGLGLFSEQEVKNQPLEKPLYKKYYMHGVSHFIGLDVHDVGSNQMPFVPNMILSCEPGIYIKEENIGIRIETMLQITAGEPLEMLPNIPRSTQEIEKAMAK